MTSLDPFPEPVLDRLGSTIGGAFTHRRLSELFQQARIEDVTDGARWLRVREGLRARQARDQSANAVAQFVKVALSPGNFLGRREDHERLRTEVNEALALVGLHVKEDGELQVVPTARTLNEAEARADRLRAELERRRVHPEVLRYCRAELLGDDYFHATLEAAKSVAQKLRELTGLTTDGSELVDTALALGGDGPYLLFNSLADDTQRSEHTGLASLLRGLFQVFRNPPAHRPRIHASVDEGQAMDMFTLASYLHRRLDAATVVRRA